MKDRPEFTTSVQKRIGKSLYKSIKSPLIVSDRRPKKSGMQLGTIQLGREAKITYQLDLHPSGRNFSTIYCMSLDVKGNGGIKIDCYIDNRKPDKMFITKDGTLFVVENKYTKDKYQAGQLQDYISKLMHPVQWQDFVDQVHMTNPEEAKKLSQNRIVAVAAGTNFSEEYIYSIERLFKPGSYTHYIPLIIVDHEGINDRPVYISQLRQLQSKKFNFDDLQSNFIEPPMGQLNGIQAPTSKEPGINWKWLAIGAAVGVVGVLVYNRWRSLRVTGGKDPHRGY